MNTARDMRKTDNQTDLEKYYRIVGNGKLQMKEDTPAKSKEFQKNLRRLIDAKLTSRNIE